MNKRRQAICTLMLALGLVVWCSGCPKGAYHDAVVAEHDFTVGLAAVQQAEMTEFQAGRIDASEHQKLEAGIEKIAKGGQILNAALQTNATNTTILADFAGIDATLTDLLNSGVTGIKNPQSQAVVKAVLQTIQATLKNVGVLLSTAPATAAPKGGF